MASAEEYAGWIVANKDKKGTPEFETVAKAYALAKSQPVAQPKGGDQSKLRLDAVEPPGFLDRVLAKLPNWMGDTTAVRGILQGGADAPIGAAQAVGNLVGQGEAVNKFVNDKEKEYQDTRSDPNSFDWWRLGGNAIGPANMVAAGPAAATTAGRILTGAKIGAFTGATNPVVGGDSYFGDKALQVATGAALGAALPAGWEAAKIAGRGTRNIAQSLYPSGIDKIVGRQWNLNAGDKRDEIIDLLTKYQPPASGAPLTAGQVAAPANRAEVAALQQLGENAKPSLFSGEMGINQAQFDARRAHLDKAAQVGTNAKEDTLKALRDSTMPDRINALKDANKTGVSSAELTKPLDSLLSSPGSRASDAMQKAIGAVNEKIKSLTNKKGVIDAFDLDTIRKELGSTIKNAVMRPDGSWDSKWAASQEIEIKKAIDKAIDKAAGTNQYTNHLKSYAEGMRNVNDITVGRELDKSLVRGTGEESATSFLNAVKNATQTPDMLRGTGAARVGNIDDAMTPRGVGIKNDLVDELLAQRNFESLAKAGMSNAVKNVGVSMPDIAPTGMFNPKISVARALANRFIGNEHGKVLARSGEASIDPQMIAKMMKDAKPFERQKIVDELMKRYAVIAGQQP